MGARRSLWQKTIKPIEVIGLIAVLIVAIALIIVEVKVYGTGFKGKTLWDWLQLLIIPAVLALGGYLFTFTISRNERKTADRHNQTEREISQDNQREAALQEYIDKLSELLLHEKLRASAEEDEVRKIARVRTITVLFQLDARRIGYVFAFLRETGLMSNKSNDSIVSLNKANLENINFSEANLERTNLSGANLSNANLRNANLSDVYLNGAILYQADFSFANLSGALQLHFLGDRWL